MLTSPPSIAFYAPLKSPDHPVPSGDRLMARHLRTALGAGVQLASGLRSYLRDPQDAAGAASIAAQATAEIERLSTAWQANGPPALWVCYHPYYKSPDLIGPVLCARFGVPYLTVESSVSARRDIGHWAKAQERVREGVAMAALNICLTQRDQAGLLMACPKAATAMLAPFIDPTPFLRTDPVPDRGRLICVAMMRHGDKTQSYAFLSAALQSLTDIPWRLSVIGDGEAQASIKTMFAPIVDRIDWFGALPTTAVAVHLSRASLYVWPGCGEAYGLAYLEAQAAGLPVVAQRIAGVPEVVAEGQGGMLTQAGDITDYAAAIRLLLTDENVRYSLSRKARGQVMRRHSLVAASVRLTGLLARILDPAP
jgi:glycosyltransferase involved in cell wall biosynthesis